MRRSTTELARKERVVFVNELDGRIVGFAKGGPFREEYITKIVRTFDELEKTSVVEFADVTGTVYKSGRRFMFRPADDSKGKQITRSDLAKGKVGVLQVSEPADSKQGSARKAELYSIYVERPCWGQGIGTAMLNQLMCVLRLDAYRMIYLWVLEANARARGFYRRHQFMQVGRKKEMIGSATFLHLKYQRRL